MNNNETNPLILNDAINDFITRNGYDWTVQGILDQYEKYQRGEYVSHTAKQVIYNCIIPFNNGIYQLQSQSLPAVEQPEKDIAPDWFKAVSLAKNYLNDKPDDASIMKAQVNRLIHVIETLTSQQPSQPESLTKMLSIAPPEKWLKMYEHYQELLAKEDVSGFWQENFQIADKERNEVKDISNDLAESYAKLQIEYGKKCAELNELKIDGHEGKTLEYIKQFISDWMSGHEPDTFIANKHGNYIYSNGPSSLNLKILFEDLLVYYMDANQPRKEPNYKKQIAELQAALDAERRKNAKLNKK